MKDSPVLSVQDVSIIYEVPRGEVKATNHVSFELHEGEALALIGESGSGKTTVSLSLIKMLPTAARITGGKALYTRGSKTESVFDLDDERMRAFRWQDCAMVFQGAQNAFNPVLKIKEQFLDTAKAHGWRNKREVLNRAAELFKLVRLDPERVFGILSP